MTCKQKSQSNTSKQAVSKKFLLLKFLLKPLITIGAKQMITQILDRASNIAQAQTRLVKHNIFSLCIALLVAALGGVIFLLSVIAIIVAIFISLKQVLPTSAACAIVGIILLIISSALMLKSKSIYFNHCSHSGND